MQDKFFQFNRRKKQQFMKNDRSLKQSIDNRIKGLCDKINKNKNYYTTSSCSGRVLLFRNIKEKRDDVIIYSWHNAVKLKELNNVLRKIKTKELIYFKQDPCILHVACRNLEDSQKLHDVAKETGWKRCGVIASGKRFVVELNGTERLEFPIIYYGKMLVDDNFLKIAVKEANKKLKESWNRIDKLEKAI
ncbi:hypothetical protein J4466_03340 [Candidatus Pacearchaeota archaeon]|nr:hypothetical protein [Candidatus Pacearchaeota archaeon]